MKDFINRGNGIKVNYDGPRQVLFVDIDNYDYLEACFYELSSGINRLDLDINKVEDIIELALETNNYSCGILYEDDKIICGCCGGIIELKDIIFLRIFRSWIDFSRKIEGE